MAMSGGSGPGGEMSDINITPLVDVMLVLLIIFMVTAPMMNSAGVEIELPQSDAPPLMEDPEKDQLEIILDKDGAVYLNEFKYEVDELPEKLVAQAEANPDLNVFLRADGDVPYRQVALVLGIARRSGMPKVGLVFEPRGEESE